MNTFLIIAILMAGIMTIMFFVAVVVYVMADLSGKKIKRKVIAFVILTDGLAILFLIIAKILQN